MPRARRGAPYISIHALREEGDPKQLRQRRPKNISIHALREEGDFSKSRLATASFYFYPRPPRGGRRYAPSRRCLCDAFLSTPSARRATITLRYFVFSFRISIHALREEGDQRRSKRLERHLNFYPRPPRGGRRFKRRQDVKLTIFLSTPSARRATRAVIAAGTCRADFYPRPPRGGRLVILFKP